MTALEPFETVQMLGRWPVVLPAYRVEHCRVQPNWEEGRLLSMHAHLKPGDVLYDVGAEHGDLSALYATWVRQDVEVLRAHPNRVEHRQRGGVVLVEGSDKFWPVIRATFEANGLTPAGCWAGFASDHDTPEAMRTPSWALDLLCGPGEWPSWTTEFPAAPHHGFKSVVESKDTIPNLRFDSLADSDRIARPDALTIDVEGAEAKVLRGASEILARDRPLVWVSLHPQLLWFDYPEWDGMTAEDVKPWFVAFMAAFRYRAHFLEDNHESHYICLPDESTADPYAGVEHLRP